MWVKVSIPSMRLAIYSCEIVGMTRIFIILTEIRILICVMSISVMRNLIIVIVAIMIRRRRPSERHRIFKRRLRMRQRNHWWRHQRIMWVDGRRMIRCIGQRMSNTKLVKIGLSIGMGQQLPLMSRFDPIHQLGQIW